MLFDNRLAVGIIVNRLNNLNEALYRVIINTHCTRLHKFPQMIFQFDFKVVHKFLLKDQQLSVLIFFI